MLRALCHQAVQCEKLGSPMYARLFSDLAADYADNGRTFALLAGRSQRPIHDAIPLRFAAAVHRIVLEGKDERLARHYPSVGGTPQEDFTADVIAYMRDHIAAIDSGLTQQVQTNEIGRSVVPLVLSHWITQFDVTQFDYLEIGASAGLNMNFDKYYACFGPLRMGNPRSAVRFMADWFANAPHVPRTSAQIHRRRGVDISPLHISDPDEHNRLLSFIWPDQIHRFARTQHALNIATTHPVVIDQDSAETWIGPQLNISQHRPTVVFHSIVWQYLGRDRQATLRNVLTEKGTQRTYDAPLFWARMEPAGDVADIRVTMWNGGEPREYVLATIGYHGQNMNWISHE